MLLKTGVYVQYKFDKLLRRWWVVQAQTPDCPNNLNSFKTQEVQHYNGPFDLPHHKISSCFLRGH
jgi:hypothetical protein